MRNSALASLTANKAIDGFKNKQTMEAVVIGSAINNFAKWVDVLKVGDASTMGRRVLICLTTGKPELVNIDSYTNNKNNLLEVCEELKNHETDLTLFLAGFINCHEMPGDFPIMDNFYEKLKSFGYDFSEFEAKRFFLALNINERLLFAAELYPNRKEIRDEDFRIFIDTEILPLIKSVRDDKQYQSQLAQLANTFIISKRCAQEISNRYYQPVSKEQLAKERETLIDEYKSLTFSSDIPRPKENARLAQDHAKFIYEQNTLLKERIAAIKENETLRKNVLESSFKVLYDRLNTYNTLRVADSNKFKLSKWEEIIEERNDLGHIASHTESLFKQAANLGITE